MIRSAQGRRWLGWKSVGGERWVTPFTQIMVVVCVASFVGLCLLVMGGEQ